MGSTETLAPLGRLLRGLRQIVGMTQRAHADAAGVAPPYLSKVERGRGNASASQRLELITALGTEPVKTQGRLAMMHADGWLSDREVEVLLAHHAARPLICLYRSHPTFGSELDSCACGERLTCRPEGHVCPAGCEPAQREMAHTAPGLSGTCPVCEGHAEDVGRHVTTQHPDYMDAT